MTPLESLSTAVRAVIEPNAFDVHVQLTGSSINTPIPGRRIVPFFPPRAMALFQCSMLISFSAVNGAAAALYTVPVFP